MPRSDPVTMIQTPLTQMNSVAIVSVAVVAGS